jgi:hypothetical protein
VIVAAASVPNAGKCAAPSLGVGDLRWFCRNKPALVTWAETNDGMTLMIEALREVIKRKHYPLERVANFEGQFKRPKSRTLTHSRVGSGRDGALSVRCPAHR